MAANRDPNNPFDDRALGLVMLGMICFCAISGTGIGVFFEEPEIGGLAGGAFGIVLGIWVIPGLMRDWRD